MLYFLLLMMSVASAFGCGGDKPRPYELSADESGGADALPVPVQSKLRIAWSETFNAKKLGVESDPLLEGKSIAMIVSSQVSGRADGLLCSSCHNRNEASGGYGINVDFEQASKGFDPKLSYSGRAWVGTGGWAEAFIKNQTKPNNLKLLMQAWINQGYK